MTSLLERLGRPNDAKLVILVCDGLGSSNAANSAITKAIREGVATTAGLQVPCPWARGAAAAHQGEDTGVSLTVNAEHQLYRWGPVTYAPSLLGGDGGFPQTPADVWDHADVDEVRRECRSQIERAVLWGFDPSHLSAHLNTLCSRPEFFGTVLDLAIEFDLPMSLPDPSVDLGFDARSLAAAEGVLVPDHVVATLRPDQEARVLADQAIAELQPGVTELHVRPAIDTPELRALTPYWPCRVGDAHLVTTDWTFRSLLDRSGAKLIGFKQIRAAQRKSV